MYKVSSCSKDKIKRSLIISILLSGLMIGASVEAKDFGIVGHSFVITEEGFLTMIKRKGNMLNLEQENRKMQEYTKDRVEEPQAVIGIKRTTDAKSYTYDPTYILDENVYLPDGTLLYSEGTRVNPFDHMSYDKALVFVDASDLEQVEWLKDNLINGEFKKEDKLILVKGKPFELQDELDTHVYFDQGGVMIEKFGIEQVPAVVRQEDKLMRINEVKI
jgi:conjugal transfer pilus assembly protein TraW